MAWGGALTLASQAFSVSSSMVRARSASIPAIIPSRRIPWISARESIAFFEQYLR